MASNKKNKVSLESLYRAMLRLPDVFTFERISESAKPAVLWDGSQSCGRHAKNVQLGSILCLANQREIALVSDATITVIQSFSYCLEGKSS